MAFSNINKKGIKEMKGNRNVGTKDAFCSDEYCSKSHILPRNTAKMEQCSQRTNTGRLRMRVDVGSSI